jgi:hypothetical protein
MLCVLAKGDVTLFPYDPDACCTGIFVPLTVGSLSVGPLVLGGCTYYPPVMGMFPYDPCMFGNSVC